MEHVTRTNTSTLSKHRRTQRKSWNKTKVLTPGCFLACSTAVRNSIAPLYKKCSKEMISVPFINNLRLCRVVHGFRPVALCKRREEGSRRRRKRPFTSNYSYFCSLTAVCSGLHRNNSVSNFLVLILYQVSSAEHSTFIPHFHRRV